MTKQPTAHELNCFTNATSFTAVRGRGAQRTRKDFLSFDAAKAYAAEFGDGRTMIYAVTANGSSGHIMNA
jgi:hypothetical protein